MPFGMQNPWQQYKDQVFDGRHFDRKKFKTLLEQWIAQVKAQARAQHPQRPAAPRPPAPHGLPNGAAIAQQVRSRMPNGAAIAQQVRARIGR